MIIRRTSLLLAVLIAGACVPKREPPAPQPSPQPPVQTAPRPQPQPVPPPPRADWRDMPLTPGNWLYSASGQTSQAAFGPAGGQAAFLVRCDRVRRQVSLGRQGAAAAGTMTVRSSSDARNLPAAVQVDYAWAALPADDRLLDGLVFSRGRFAIEAPGTAMLVIPSWPEPARVIEDCRG
jgi:hypothetical protein